MKVSKNYDKVIEDPTKMPGANWFPGAKLNFAKNCCATETTKWPWCSKARCWNRSKSLMPNMIESVVAMLAVTSIGAIWSSCSPDFGIKGVLDRFGQIEPKVLFTANGYKE